MCRAGICRAGIGKAGRGRQMDAGLGGICRAEGCSSAIGHLRGHSTYRRGLPCRKGTDTPHRLWIGVLRAAGTLGPFRSIWNRISHSGCKRFQAVSSGFNRGAIPLNNHDVQSLIRWSHVPYPGGSPGACGELSLRAPAPADGARLERRQPTHKGIATWDCAHTR